MKLLYLLLMLTNFALLQAATRENHAPVVENVRFEQRMDGSLLVDVYYDAIDTDDDSLLVTLHASMNDGAMGSIQCVAVTGDIGIISPGKQKHMVWDLYEDNPRISGNFRLRVSADDLNNMALVTEGEFSMGSASYPDAMPIHKVWLSSYFIDKYEVTNSQYAEFLNTYGSDKVMSGADKGQLMITPDDWGIKNINGVWQAAPGYENHPAVMVKGIGAIEFARFYGKRLPTEAEWEKAALGGKLSNHYLYSGDNDLNLVGWNVQNSEGHTHIVGKKLPNELGIYDMSGNVWELCADWYDEKYYSESPYENPQGPKAGALKSARGGSWQGFDECRTTYRGGGWLYIGTRFIGFRCAVSK